jgi:hypothetical protein
MSEQILLNRHFWTGTSEKMDRRTWVPKDSSLLPPVAVRMRSAISEDVSKPRPKRKPSGYLPKNKGKGERKRDMEDETKRLFRSDFSEVTFQKWLFRSDFSEVEWSVGNGIPEPEPEPYP